MQISMPPAKPPAGTGARGLRPPPRPSPAADFVRPGPSPAPCPGEAPRGDTQGELLTSAAPPAPPGSGEGPGRPGTPGSAAGPADWGFGPPGSPPARIAFPGCVSLAFPGAGAAAARARGAAIAGRREARGGRPALAAGPSLRCSAQPAEVAAAGYVRGRGGRVSSRLRPAWFEPGPAPGPPRVGRETEAGAGTAAQPMDEPDPRPPRSAGPGSSVGGAVPARAVDQSAASRPVWAWSAAGRGGSGRAPRRAAGRRVGRPHPCCLRVWPSHTFGLGGYHSPSGT